MEIQIQISTAPIPATLEPPSVAGLGAWVEFRGNVRDEENGERIAALEYEAYQPMAELEIRRLLERLSAESPCLAARVIHRTGVVPVGEAAIYVGIAGRHRGEAFTMLAAFMDGLKQDVPIWKRCAIPVRNGHHTECGASSKVQQTSSPQGHAHSAHEVRSLLRSLCRPLETERVPLLAAAGRVLREPIQTSEDQPGFDRSSVDGFAIRLDDPSINFRIVDQIRAGDWKPQVLERGEAVQVATGGALPCEKLQVIMKEDTSVERGALTVLIRNGERNIRFRGEDAKAGQEVLAAGSILTPGALGLASSLGCPAPVVTRLPTALHLVTGNEIVPFDQRPAPGQIRDSNSTMVWSLLQRWNILPTQKRVAEDATEIEAELRKAGSNFDLLLISGGSSVGEHDFTRRLLEAAGFEIHVSKTTARPGKPMIVASRGAKLAFGLPGNPLAHFVCMNLYVRAALEAWAGQSRPSDFQQGKLTAGLAAGGNSRETFWPANWSFSEGSAWLAPLPWRSSGDLTALATANALVHVPSGATALQRGDRVGFLIC